jgi:DNA-binding CsgD family transcriptional regulator
MKSIEINITTEEKQIASRLANGEKSEQIGVSLGYKPNTFAARLKEIRVKYDCKNSLQFVAYFLREGIIS